MKYIMSLSVKPSKYNYDREVEINGTRIRINHLGCNYDYQLMRELLEKYDGEVDVFALEGLPNLKKFNRRAKEGIIEELARIPKKSMVVDGEKFKDIYVPWILREFVKRNKDFFTRKKVGFLSALYQYEFVTLIKEFSKRTTSLDPYILMGIPMCLKDLDEIESFRKKTVRFSRFMGLRNKYHDSNTKQLDNASFDAFKSGQIFVANESLLALVDRSFLKGKTLIVDSLNQDLRQELIDLGIHEIVSCIPDIYNIENASFSLLEAILQVDKESSRVTMDDVIEWIDLNKVSPDLTTYSRPLEEAGSRKFAFIIHPLSRDYYFKSPVLKHLRPLKNIGGKVLESVTSKLSGTHYGTISGIKSVTTGHEVEGLIYSVFETPKKMMDTDPEIMYDKMIKLCEKAEGQGAEIIGLGAYTKIVGDAGITVDRYSPIPVTTGNSLSVSSTLWAAKECVKKMGMVTLNERGKVSSTAMVVGATGSIGSVTAKILSSIFEELVIVAPRPYKLLELQKVIKEMSPHCHVVASTDTNKYLDKCHLIITTTSNQGKKLLDIEKVSPGCVICDVSRPFDISKKDALTRPDVLVIANGEVELPGSVAVDCDLGLKGSVVYACLAETALLAMEGRIESFTLSRDISVEKVKDIYKMARKHGVRLAQITGPIGDVTDEEIKLCREHALKKVHAPFLQKQ